MTIRLTAGLLSLAMVIAQNNQGFEVALLSCPSADTHDCFFVCAGSLIAPNVVVTLRRCVEDHSVAFGSRKPLLGADTAYIQIGAPATPTEFEKSKLIGVSSMQGTDVHANDNYLGDMDVGLVFLKDCVATAHLPKISTLSVENLKSCGKLGFARYGVAPNLPNLYRSIRGRFVEDKAEVVPFDECVSSIADLKQTYPMAGDREFLSVKDVVPDLHFCVESNSPACTSDGGAGLVDPSSGILEGIISFMNPLELHACSVGPSVAQPVAPLAWWIAKQMQSITMCDGWEIKDSFASWPPEPLSTYSDAYKASRCTGNEWQCANGACIPRSKVCDESNTCEDASDENEALCHGLTVEMPFGRLNKNESIKVRKRRTVHGGECKGVVSPVTEIMNEETQRMQIDYERAISGAENVLSKYRHTCQRLEECISQLDESNDTVLEAKYFCEDAARYLEHVEMRERFTSSVVGSKIHQMCPKPQDDPATVLSAVAIVTAAVLAVLLFF